MRADLDDLLRAASPDPAAGPDIDTLWAAGRRRRRRRILGTATAGVAGLALLAVVVVGVAVPRAPVIDPVGEPEEPVTEEPVTEEPEPAEDPAPEPEPDPDPVPEPDPAAMADPCAPYVGAEDTLVIDVVSPVEGQHVGDEIELVGCARVFEATVQYRVLGPDGEPLVEHFTTATAGGPDIGEFRETIQLDATGALTLEVFWLDVATGEEAADDPERDLVAVEVVAE